MSKQHILVELKQFIQALSTKRRLTSNTLLRSSLRLLEDLPAARQIVFEYFALVGELAVQNYVKTTNIDPQTGLPLPHSKNYVANSETTELENCFASIQEALENLINKGPQELWPIIASWSLDLVGNLSDKYTQRKTSIAANCNFWLSCDAMHGLLTLISLTFRKLTNADAESCVMTLLNVFQRCPMTFDWAVARLGGCFPQKIISQILQCSLKRFTEDIQARFDSEIGILDYLSFAHEQELKTSVQDLLETGFEPKRSLDVSIIPFLMVLSNYSDAFLQALTNVFLNMYNDELRATIVRMTPLWKSNKLFLDMQPSLNNVALRLNSHGVEILIAVAKMAEEYNWCQEFLEYTLQEFEQVILNGRTCPIMCDLATEETKYMLWKSCLSTKYEQQTAVRLLLIVSTQHSHIYYQTISELLRRSYDLNRDGLGAVIRMIGGHCGVVEFPDIKPGLQMVFEDVLLQEQFQRSRLAANAEEAYNTFKNLNTLTKMQSKSSLTFSKHLPIANVLLDCLPKILQILDVTLNKLVLEMDKKPAKSSNSFNNNNNESTETDSQKKKIRTPLSSSGSCAQDEISCHEEEQRERLKVADTIIDLLNAIEAGSKTCVMRTTEVLKLAVLSVKYFFVCLSETFTVSRSAGIENVCALFRRQCPARNSARAACLRELVEGTLFYYGNLFGQYEEPYVNPLEIPDHEMVLAQNQRHTPGINANRSILHAGVIGRGVRQTDSGANISNNCNQEIQNLLLRALDCCCCTNTEKPEDTANGFSMISLLLVELVSTDVMYNGLPFPEEEFTKTTIERDLMIRRAFNTSPVLWALLGFIATHRPALCLSSVLLRALCATCLHQWRAKNVLKFQTPQVNEELMQCTKKVLQVLAVGQLLPPPLSNLHSIIEHFEPSEIALILKECVWNYMKDHVPVSTLFQKNQLEQYWRNPSTSHVPSKYTDTLRSLMQKKLTTLGAHYHQMFVMADAYDCRSSTPVSVKSLAIDPPTIKPLHIEVDCTADD